MHWAVELILRGITWEKGAQGPHSYDCWSFLRYVQKEYFNIEVPLIGIDADNLRDVVKALKSHPEFAHWDIQSKPSHGDSVLMSQGKEYSHVGVWIEIDGGGVLHCVRGSGVIFSDLTSLKLAGWNNIEFYTHASHR
jgi:hypothetical protein